MAVRENKQTVAVDSHSVAEITHKPSVVKCVAGQQAPGAGLHTAHSRAPGPCVRGFGIHINKKAVKSGRCVKGEGGGKTERKSKVKSRSRARAGILRFSTVHLHCTCTVHRPLSRSQGTYFHKHSHNLIFTYRVLGFHCSSAHTNLLAPLFQSCSHVDR